MSLLPDTVLRRVPDLTLRVDSSDSLRIKMDGKTIQGGIHGLAVLSAFSVPRTLSAALESLSSGPGGLQDWVGVTSTIIRLYEAGVLQDRDGSAPALRRTTKGFDAARIHVEMLNDTARTSSFIEAVTAAVEPGDVVLDIGTGSGVLAVAAAKAGARHVYAVEAGGMGRLAEQVFEANGVADRVTLVPGWSTRIDLPEPADVLVSEVIGNDPLGEQVLEVTADARSRHLKPGARIVPARLQILGTPVVVPEEELANWNFMPKTIETWQQVYGMDFQPLAEAGREADLTFFLKPERVKPWRRLSEPFQLADIPFLEFEQPRLDERTMSVQVTASGRLNGFVVHFELTLHDDIRFSVHPDEADGRCSWAIMISTCRPRDVEKGDSLTLKFGYAGPGTSSRLRLLDESD
jgi:hypothetical protein